MLKLLVLVSILIALAAADYNFQDSDFNQLLFDDLTVEVENEPLRHKRGAENQTDSQECHRRKKDKRDKGKHCCNDRQTDSSNFDEFKDVKMNCVNQARNNSANDVDFDPLNCDGVQLMRQQLVCVGECIAKKFDLIDESGELKRDALVNHTLKMVGNSTWKAEVLEDYVDKCLDELKASASSDSSKENPKAEGCNQNPLQFHHCIWKKFVEGCPAELQADSKKCKKIRERVAMGDTSGADKALQGHSHHSHHSHHH